MYKSIIPTNAPTDIGIPKVIPFSNHIDCIKGKKIQASSSLIEEPSDVVEGSFNNNGFMSAVHLAFSQHLPLLIVPDDIWHVFLSQVSVIINKHPEKYRPILVDFKGKMTIQVVNDSLLMDTMDESQTKLWESVFSVFEEEISKKSKVNLSLNFSTTSKVHSIVGQIILMDCVRNFFDYEVHTKCGFPEIRIGGTLEDWNSLDESIREISDKISEGHGTNYLRFTDECKKVLQDAGNPDFWEHLYHFHGAKGSGQKDIVTGIVNDLFPFNNKGQLVSGLGNKRGPDSFPVINSSVPFVWNYRGIKHKCEFEGGSTHVSWNPDMKHLYVKPSWIVYRITKKGIIKD